VDGLSSRAPHEVENQVSLWGLGSLPKGDSSPAPKALKWRSMGTKQSESTRQRPTFVESQQERLVLTLSPGVSRPIIPFWPLGKSG
jgi:hypothetical protein